MSTNVGGIPKIVHDSENGFCCEAGDVNAMANGIVRMLSTRKMLESMSKESFRIAKGRLFS